MRHGTVGPLVPDLTSRRRHGLGALPTEAQLIQDFEQAVGAVQTVKSGTVTTESTTAFKAILPWAAGAVALYLLFRKKR